MKKAMRSKIDFESIVAGKLVLVALPRAPELLTYIRNCHAKHILTLLPHRSDTLQHSFYVEKPFSSLRNVGENNCQVAILDSISCAALTRKRYFARTRLEKILIPMDATLLFALPGLTYYRHRKWLALEGKTTIRFAGKHYRYMVLSVQRRQIPNRRLYAPADWDAGKILNHIQNINYAVLRGIDRIEAGAAVKDIDLLVSDQDLPKLRELLSQEIGLVPLDVHTESGIDGHSFESVPYFEPQFARRILDSAQLRESGFRAPSPKYQYLSLIYHLIFHGKSRHIPPETTMLDETTFGRPHHYKDLVQLAQQAGMPIPTSFDDLDNALQRNDAFPSKDLIGFYARRNPFVARRYLGRKFLRPGLATFFVRDFGYHELLIETVREALEKEYCLLAEGPIDTQTQRSIIHKARGGNWRDETSKQLAEPIYWFLCFDEHPIAPTGRLRRKYPNLDNERTARIKYHIRNQTAARIGVSRVVHASDNSDEAYEHIQAIGLEKYPAVCRVVEQLRIN